MGIDPNTAYFLVNDSFNPPKVVQVDRTSPSNIILADQDWSNGSGEFMFIEKRGSSYLFNFAKDGQYLSSTSSGTIATKWLAVAMVTAPPTKDEKFEISIISDNGFELSVRIKSRSNRNYLEAKNTGTNLLMNSTQSARGIWNLVPLPKLKEIRDNKTKSTWLINHLWYYSSYFGGAVQETGLYPYTDSYTTHPNNGIQSAARAKNPGVNP